MSSPSSMPRYGRFDLLWSLSLFATAIGSGIMFLPIALGSVGVINWLIAILLSFPIVYYSHSAFLNYVMAGKTPHSTVTDVSSEYFPFGKALLINILFGLSVYSALLVYAVAELSSVRQFLSDVLHIPLPSHFVLCVLVSLGMLSFLFFSRALIVRFFEIVVYPFVIFLVVCAAYLLYTGDFSQFLNNPMLDETIKTPGLPQSIVMVLSVLFFTYAHLPIISPLVLAYKNRPDLAGNDEMVRALALRSLRFGHALMVLVVIFFCVACIVSVPYGDMLAAKEMGVSILVYIAKLHQSSAFLHVLTPIVAIVAILKSFVAHSLGVQDSIMTIVNDFFPSHNRSKKFIITGINVFIFITVFVLMYYQWDLFNIINKISSPFMGLVLLGIPLYVFSKSPFNKYFKSKFLIGFLAFLFIILMISLLL